MSNSYSRAPDLTHRQRPISPGVDNRLLALSGHRTNRGGALVKRGLLLKCAACWKGAA